MLNGLRTNCYKVTMLFQRQGDKKSVWICPAHPHTIYAFITKELRLKRLLVKFQNNFFRHFTRIARRTHIGNSRSGQTRQVFFLNTQFRQMLRDTYPTLTDNAFTASTAAFAASSWLMPSLYTFIALAISTYLGKAAGALNSIMTGSNSALATP